MSSMFIPLYHGVIGDNEFAHDPFEQVFQKHLPVSEFEAQIKWFNDHFQMTSVKKFYHNCIQNRPGTPSAMLTFDDVYANFSQHALSILEKYNCPATIFLCLALSSLYFFRRVCR